VIIEDSGDAGAGDAGAGDAGAGDAPPLPPDARRRIDSRSAMLNVTVPGDARIFVNDLATSSTGSQRHYVSRDLQPGYTYTYQLRAEYDQDGQTMTETKVVRLNAGQSARVSFDFADEAPAQSVAQQDVVTKLTVNVPADATVYLSGKATRSTGPVREFSTTKLASGQSWDGYTIRVELDRAGQMTAREQTITLVGGRAQSLAFDFDATQVARAEASDDAR
jgi:uncharacterized protein (TIGR03000 family)